MKKKNLQYIIIVCMTLLFIITTTTVFAQQQELSAPQQVLSMWAEAYGKDEQRIQMMSDTMKKTYIQKQVERANENTFFLVSGANAKNAQLHDKLDVVSFELDGNDTIFYTLKAEDGKEYHQAEYVKMIRKGNDFFVENSAMTNVYNWKTFTPIKKQPTVNELLSSTFTEGDIVYPPVITVTGAEKIDKEVLPLFLDHLETVFTKGHSSYYIIEMLNIAVDDVKMEKDSITIDFKLQEVLRNYPKDPDSVEYIKKAKETKKDTYEQLYKQYQSPFYGNYMIRFIGNIKNTDSFRMYTGQENEKGKIIYNWPIQQQFPEMDSDGSKVYLGTINGIKDDYGRMLMTINRKEYNADTRGTTENGFFITAYGQQFTFPLKKQANVTCMNNGKMELVDTESFAEAASQTAFGRSRLFWFKVEDNYIVEINEFLEESERES